MIKGRETTKTQEPAALLKINCSTHFFKEIRLFQNKIFVQYIKSVVVIYVHEVTF